MSMDAPQRPPTAGWYHDPQAPTLLRWWDGGQWTSHTRPVEDAPIVPPAAPAHPVHAVHPVHPAHPDDLAPNYVPFASSNRPASSVISRFVPDITYTTPCWAIALSPLWAVVLGLVAAFVAPAIDPEILGVLPGALGLVAFIVLVVLAAADRAQLRGEGHLEPVSPLWILLGPLAYLIARGIRTRSLTGQGFKPLVAFAILAVLAPIAFALVLFAIVGLGIMPAPSFVPTP
jgi:Protein of unknown function (DUF2510)